MLVGFALYVACTEPWETRSWAPVPDSAGVKEDEDVTGADA